MALVFMEKGGICHVSDEDYEAACGYAWKVFRLRPSGRVTAWWPVQSHGRRFDLFLHRLIAVRMDPTLDDRVFRVLPRDGDYLNCRRENLEIIIRKPERRGPAPRPGGTPAHGVARRRPRPGPGAQGDLGKLWNPSKWLPTKRKLQPRHGEGGDGPPSRPLGRDPR